MNATEKLKPRQKGSKRKASAPRKGGLGASACSALLNDFHRRWYGRSGTIKDGHLKAGSRVICTGVCDDGADRELMGYQGALPTGQIFVKVDGMEGEQCVLPSHVEWEPNASDQTRRAQD